MAIPVPGTTPRQILITGTGTGVGKTVLTALLARRAVEQGLRVAAFKPLASGSRADARLLRRASDTKLPLEILNPWSFRRPLAPLLAARAEGRTVRRADLLRHLEIHGAGHDCILMEGAGGLRTPLGEDFDALDLLGAWRAQPVLVAVNRLGVLHEVLLAWDALPAGARRLGRVVLMAPSRRDPSCRTNPLYLRERLGVDRIVEVPRLPQWPGLLRRPLTPGLRRTLDFLLAGR
ncbi:MAG: dethiobiotin synthase [Verrucomicrobiae bacterium]|nr:dethiobiotin synthase [Verrucomicrobiae bacterium]